MKKLFLASVTALMFFGCTTKTVQAPTQYTLKTQLETSKEQQSQCKSKSIKIFKPFGSMEYASSDIYYVVLPHEEDIFNQSAWAESVSSIVYRGVLDAVRDSGVFGGVLNYASVSKSDLALEIEINDFKQYFEHDLKSSYILSDITFTLVDTANLSTIAQKQIRKKIEVKSLDAKGGVEALSSALNQTLNEAVEWMAESCSDK